MKSLTIILTIALFLTLFACNVPTRLNCYGDEDCIRGWYCETTTGWCAPLKNRYPDAGSDAETDLGKDVSPDGAVDAGRAATVTYQNQNGESKTKFEFSDHIAGENPKELILTLKNLGDYPATDITVALEGEFQFKGGKYPGEGGTCGEDLSATCQVVLEFSIGSSQFCPEDRYSGKMVATYFDGFFYKDSTVYLKEICLNPANLVAQGDNPYSFPERVNIGETYHIPLELRVENTGSLEALIEEGEITGSGFEFKGGQFPGISPSACGNSIYSGSSCLVTISFSPKHGGISTGSLKIGYFDGLTTRYLYLNLLGESYGAGGSIGWGEDSWWFTESMIHAPAAAVTDSAGNLLVSDANAHRIHKISAAGDYIGWIGDGKNDFQTVINVGTSGTGDREFNSPEGLAVDTNGNLYVVDTANHRIQKWLGCTGTGTTCTYAGWIGGGSPNFKTGLAPSAGTNDMELNSPSGIALNFKGHLFIADASNHRIQKWVDCDGADSTCAYQGFLGGGQENFHQGNAPSSNTTDRSFSFPKDLTIDENGHLYISDTFNHRIQKWLNCSGNTPDTACTYAGWIGNGYPTGFKSGAVAQSGDGDGYLNQPRGIALDPNGSLYIADTDNHRIQKWSACQVIGDTCEYQGWIGKNGTTSHHTTFLKSGRGMSGILDMEFHSPAPLFIDSSGHLFIVDSDNHRIQKWQVLGENPLYLGWIGGYQGEFGTGAAPVLTDPEIRFFNSPAGIALDPYGNLFIADSNTDRVQKWNFYGQFMGFLGGGYSSIVSAGTSYKGFKDMEFNLPIAVAFDSLGDLYVVDSNNHRVQKWVGCAGNGKCTYKGFLGGGFTVGYNYEEQALPGSLDGQFNRPAGIAVDSLGNLYITDADNNRIQKWEECSGDGPCRYIGWIGRGFTSGYRKGTAILYTGEARFNMPYGITLDENGNLYISDSNHHRVQKWDNCITGSCNFIGWIGCKKTRFDRHTDYTLSPGTLLSSFNQPQGLIYDNTFVGNGMLFVADYSNNRVVQIKGCFGSGPSQDACKYCVYGNGQNTCSQNTQIQTTYNYYPPQNLLLGPSSVFVDSFGNIYITESGSQRVSKWKYY